MKKYIFILIIFIFYNSNAQSGFESILLADKNDSQKILNSYFSPRINSYLNGLNSNWYYTAKVHKPYGFDLSFNLININAPSSKKTFSVDNLSSINSSNGVFSGTSSIGNQSTTNFSVSKTINNQNTTAENNFKGGANGSLFKNHTTIPIAQLNVGLSRGFDLMLRLTPETKINNENESLKVFGLGLKKEITNWFVIAEKTPLHISLLAGYNTMSAVYGIENQSFPTGNTSGLEIQNAVSEFKIHTITLKALASLDWSIFNVFGGFGYSSGNANYKMSGTFKGQYEGVLNPEIEELEIPNLAKYKYQGISATIGSKINLRFLNIYASYSLQQFNTFNIGVAFNVK
jgi:hypothetical protein